MQQRQQQKIAGSTDNATLAFELWLARGFQDGSPEEDMFRAICANSVKVSARQPPSKRTASKAKAVGASLFVGK